MERENRIHWAYVYVTPGLHTLSVMRIFSEPMLMDQSVHTAHGKRCEQKRLEIERCEKNEYLAHEHRELWVHRTQFEQRKLVLSARTERNQHVSEHACLVLSVPTERFALAHYLMCFRVTITRSRCCFCTAYTYCIRTADGVRVNLYNV